MVAEAILCKRKEADHFLNLYFPTFNFVFNVNTLITFEFYKLLSTFTNRCSMYFFLPHNCHKYAAVNIVYLIISIHITSFPTHTKTFQKQLPKHQFIKINVTRPRVKLKMTQTKLDDLF